MDFAGPDARELATDMSDSLWQAVKKSISDNTRYHLRDYRLARLSGGNINQAWHLSDREKQYFVKTNRGDLLYMFEAERAGLEEIHQSQAIRVPEVIGCGAVANHSFIVMEFLEIGGIADDSLLAHQLASMHRCTRDQFGFHIDNTIGSTAQINTNDESWVEFWRTQRLGFQLDLAVKNRLDREMIARGEALSEVVAQFFSSYRPVASLLHGDLWSGNWGADNGGNPIIFDPACYYGDHEADLAMMELFGQPGRRFFDAYDEVFSIDAGYTTRRDLYNLYHILNHANLFGGHYSSSARNLIDKLLAAV